MHYLFIFLFVLGLTVLFITEGRQDLELGSWITVVLVCHCDERKSIQRLTLTHSHELVTKGITFRLRPDLDREESL